MEDNKLLQNFDTKTTLAYTLPTIIMMVFMSTYTIVDGIFVSNFVSEEALSAVNMVMPVFSFAASMGLMLSTGASAVIGKLLGEKKESESRQFFTVVYLVGIILGVTLTVLILGFRENMIGMLGTTEVLYPLVKTYLTTAILFMTMFFLQVFTQSFFIVAGKPEIGFITCVLGGITNIILDYVFIVPMNLGIQGAALATGIGASVPGVFGLIYFTVNRKGLLYFEKPKWDMKLLGQSLYNGMSEFVGSVSIAITTLLFNLILLRLAGESGVAAISVIMYIQMIQSAVYMGYSFGIAPVISYKFGEDNAKELQQIRKISIKFIGVISIITIAISMLFAEQAVGIFISRESETFQMATQGFRLFAIAYLFMGFNIFTSSSFTALSNGKTSALLAISRSLIFSVTALLILPLLFGINGVWLAVPVAEALAFLLSIRFYKKHQSFYNY